MSSPDTSSYLKQWAEMRYIMENLSVKEIKDIVQTSSYEQYLSYINILSKDKRESVKKIAMSLSKKLDAVRKEEERLKNMFIIEESLFAEGYKKIGGVDEAIAMASQRPDFIIVDGNQQITDINHPQRCIVQGDSKSISIACASILAKVTRDKIMKQYAEIYPQYGFDKHKGYGTKEHIEAINKYGITPIHRLSFLKNIY